MTSSREASWTATGNNQNDDYNDDYDRAWHIVTRPLKEAFLASKIVILDYFSRELPFSRGEIDNSRLF